MKALVRAQYGSPEVLQVQEVAIPNLGEKDILVKVYASSVTAADGFLVKGTPYFGRLMTGLFKPKQTVPGTGFAGRVEAVGAAVEQFQVGDEVFGESGLNFGAHAEFLRVEEAGVIMKKPAQLSFEEAAILCDGPLTSFNFLREIAKIQPGQKVLINGASGSLGTAAVQLAKHFGAEVTGVSSAKNHALLKSLGADHVIDYRTEDFTQSGIEYDLIYDAVGKRSFSECKPALKKGAVYMSPVLTIRLLLQMLFSNWVGSKKAKFSATGLRPVPVLREMLKDILILSAEGKLRLIMDKMYPLDKGVAAHTYVDTGRKVGNVVLQMAKG
ncbi:MAG: NAD(P)-dependent alcohol dehydrogenase [Saprospiraceae bacterium]|nr:NAD(P)-dependent alcohol dehydrogenase [Saprospiraceae bacterium]